MLDELLAHDRELFVYLNGLGDEKYDSFWVFVTSELNWVPVFIVLLIAVFFKIPKKRVFRVLGVLIILIAFALLFTEGIKELVQRLRPSQEISLNGIIRVFKEPANYSFFSGHASTSFAITTFLVLTLRKQLWWISFLFVWPLLFAFSRIYVGVHYPLDVFTGALVGVLIAFLFYVIFRKKLESVN